MNILNHMQSHVDWLWKICNRQQSLQWNNSKFTRVIMSARSLHQTLLSIVLIVVSTELCRGQGGRGRLEVVVLSKPSPCLEKSEKGDTLAVHYTGRLTDGAVFDSSLTRGEPFEFHLGERQVIQGWDDGLRDMCVGEKRRLNVPSDMAYGDRGVGAIIPPDASLVFEVELVDLPNKNSKSNDDFFGGPPLSDALLNTKELLIQTLVKPSSCSRQAKENDTLTVHYVGYLTTSEKFDSSLDRDEPFTFVLGAGKVIPGWEEGLLEMCVGERRRLIVPPDLAYGSEGAGDGVVPPDSTLIFFIKLFKIEEGLAMASENQEIKVSERLDEQ
ncbi:peptidyl-prolyl cis-trans isomerase FKBP10-like [Oratosquilla oratoria]|uniref:peptidyl-prolyl cis-trans isomerase FKBP10-like n=1 Tax=Oratosquilla oratoria TaxID=337810 RepID=UPI003F761D60